MEDVLLPCNSSLKTYVFQYEVIVYNFHVTMAATYTLQRHDMLGLLSTMGNDWKIRLSDWEKHVIACRMVTCVIPSAKLASCAYLETLLGIEFVQ